MLELSNVRPSRRSFYLDEMEMRIYFELLTSTESLGFTPEVELDQFRDFLAPKERVHIAKITFIRGDGERLSFVDEMWHVALHLGRLGLERMVAGKKYIYSNMISGLLMEFIPEKDWIAVHLSGEFQAFQCNKKAFIGQMFHCGTRYFDLLDRLPHLGHEQSVAIYREVAQNAETNVKKYLASEG